MSRSTLRHLALAVALGTGVALAPASVAAQARAEQPAPQLALPAATLSTPTVSAPVADAPTSPVGPRIAPAGFDRHAALDADRPDAPQDRNMRAGSNVALMGVGAAAVIIGLLIGGDAGTLVAVGGGVIGLYGLFRFLR